MNASPPTPDPRPLTPNSNRSGFTLVEMLVSVGLTVLMMAILAQVFTVVAGTVSLERTLREVDGRVRSAQTVLRNDLDGITVVLAPPRDPADGEGYFEYEENTTVGMGNGFGSTGWDQWRANPISGDAVTGADTDDVIQFTTRIGRGKQRPFVGQGQGGSEESQTAEVAYFLRESRPRSGATPVVYNLYRRQLLVEATQPQALTNATGSWHWNYDLSARPNRANIALGGLPEVNRLGDLTLRENRFAHDPLLTPISQRWPHLPISFEDINVNGIYDPGDVNPAPLRITWFGRPLLRETASGDPLVTGWDSPDVYPSLNVPYLGAADGNNDGLIDGFINPRPAAPAPGERPRFAEDVLMNNVLSFNVEAWDPGAPVFEVVTPPSNARILVGPGHPQYTTLDLSAAGVQLVGFGAYVDLGYGLPALATVPATFNAFPTPPVFWTNGDPRSFPLIRTYDTWTNYGNDGVDNDPPPFGVAAEGGSPPEPFNLRLVADGINNDGDFYFDAFGRPTPMIDEGIDDGFNGADDDNDHLFWQGNGIDDDGDGLGWDANGNSMIDQAETDLDEGVNETYVTAGPGWADGIDNDNLNGVDDPNELLEAEAPPPYPVPLRGIRIRIRVLEPSSQKTREFTLIHSFRTE